MIRALKGKLYVAMNRIEQNRIEQNRIEQNRIEQNRIEYLNISLKRYTQGANNMTNKKGCQYL